jgi:hypothetical protein
MYYTDYQMKEIFTDRQSAIVSSRTKAKNEFFDSLVEAMPSCDDQGYYEAYIVRKASDYKDIAEVYETYEKNRTIVYAVQIDLLGRF